MSHVSVSGRNLHGLEPIINYELHHLKCWLKASRLSSFIRRTLANFSLSEKVLLLNETESKYGMLYPSH